MKLFYINNKKIKSQVSLKKYLL